MGERYLVDAMNVIGSRPDGWWKDRGKAMRDFASALDDHARTSAKNITVVFDGDPGGLPDVTHVEIVIARGPGPDAADREIERLVTEAGNPSDLRVVTSDRALIDKVRAAGTQVISAGTFRADLER